jgi:hypothetical protein
MLVASASPLWGIAAALVALAGVVLAQALVGLRASRDRRRNEYSAAFAAALGWCELPYKVARRLSNDREDVAPIVDAFHKAQTDLFFHRMWLRSVSSDTASAYERLVDAIQSQTQPHNVRAWESVPWDPASGPLGALYGVDVEAQQAAFSEAVQRDLSVWKRVTTPKASRSREASDDGRFQRR